MIIKQLYPSIFKVRPIVLAIIAFSSLQESFAQSWQELDSIANAYQREGKYDSAIVIGTKVCKMVEIKFGSNDSNYATILISLGRFYRDNSEYKNAITQFQAALEINERIYGKDNIKYAFNICDLAESYWGLGEYKKALNMFESALEIIKNKIGKENYYYGSYLANVGGLYVEIGEYTKALSIYRESIVILKIAMGNDHLDVGVIISNLAGLYGRLGEYNNAIPLYREGLVIFEKNLGKEHPYYAMNLGSLASIYATVGDYDNSLPLYELSLEITGQTAGKNNLEYGKSMGNLATLHKTFGNYDIALLLYEKSREICEKVQSRDHPDNANRMANMAGLYDILGDYSKALELYKNALEIYGKTLGKEHTTYGQILESIAGLYKSHGDTAEAVLLYTQGLEISEKVFGKENRHYAVSLNNLAGYYCKIGNYQKGLDLYLQSYQILEKLGQPQNLDLAITTLNLAEVYRNMEQYDNALPLFQKAIELQGNSFGKSHMKYGICLTFLARLNMNIGKNDEAFSLLHASCEIQMNELRKIFKFRSEKEKKEFIAKISSFFDEYLSMAFIDDYRNDRMVEEIVNNQLQLKGILLKSSTEIINKLSVINDTIVSKLLTDLRINQGVLNQLYIQPVDKRIGKVDSILARLNEIEDLLVKEYDKRFGEVNNFGIDWKGIRSKLKKGEVAIEFSHFHYFNGKKWTDSNIYIAYIIKNEFKVPKVVYLFEEESLKLLIRNTLPNNLYSSRGLPDALNAIRIGYSDSLYDLLWSPLLPFLKNVKTIYFATDGLLHQIAFSALRSDNQKSIINEYNLIQLSSTGNIINGLTELNPGVTELWGGVDFNYEFNTIGTSHFEFVDTGYAKLNTRGVNNQGGSWKYLPGTLKEVNEISIQLAKRSINFELVLDTMSTEARFKQIAHKNPKILHIATHGFFFENKSAISGSESQKRYIQADDPLRRAGLILAGANSIWAQGYNPNAKEDGILTAWEISIMDLRNTEMVVLSACETGLGVIDGSEGVYGLQRAFKMAGVKIVIMSLWSVPDEETSEFMNCFYKLWLDGMDIRIAFRKTQILMSEKYVDQPEKWAGFVLVE